MKRILTALISIAYLSIVAQSPLLMNYQAVVRDVSGNPVSLNTPVQLKFAIHDLTAAGTVIFNETSNIVLANQFGLITTSIGSNSNLGVVNWTNGNKYLNVQVKIGSNSFIDMGTTQLLSVPYALHASTATIADSVRGGNSGTTVTQDIIVKYNSVSINHPSINHAVLSLSGFNVSALTTTNYFYFLWRGSNTLQSFSNSSILATDTNSATPTFYIMTSPIGCNSPDHYPYQGQITGINTNHTSGVYYIPLNSTPISSIPQLYSYNCSTGHWSTFSSQYLPGYKYFQLLPNNNSVTGFNLQFPVDVTITR